jgi:hypothetical protein
MELTATDGIVYADRIESWCHPVAVNPAGRSCGVPRCHTILSIYNDSDRCALHASLGETGKGNRVHRTRRTVGSAHAMSA